LPKLPVLGAGTVEVVGAGAAEEVKVANVVGEVEDTVEGSDAI